MVVPVIDVVATDATDLSTIVTAFTALQAETRGFGSAEVWLDRLGDPVGEVPADLVVIAGRSQGLVERRWVARAAPKLPDTEVLVAVVDGSLDDIAELLKQGAGGLVPLPADPDRVRKEIRWYVDLAVRSQPSRRATARHRRNLAKLSPAEQEVLDSMFEGQANKLIAEKLSIGLRTVELRRAKIMRKMAAENLAQLIRFACQSRPCGCHGQRNTKRAARLENLLANGGAVVAGGSAGD